MPHLFELPFESFFRNNDALMLLMDDETGELLDANDTAVHFYGYSLDKIRSMKISEISILQPEEIEAEKKLAAAEQRKCVIVHHRLSNGEIRNVEVYTTRISIKNKKYSFLVVHDITDRKLIEEALRENEKKYRALFSQMNAGCALHSVICDNLNTPVDYITLEVNDAFERLIGVRREDVIGRRVSEYLPKDELTKWVGLFGPVALTGKPTRYELYSPVNNKCFEGNAYSLEPGKFVVVFLDITARKIAEEALQRNQKLESLGLLAGGIAHDFNNLLGGIFGFIDLAADATHEKDVSNYLSKALSTIDRARQLTGQLLTFSKGGDPIKKLGKLTSFIEETIKFALSGSNVSCRYFINDDLWTCEYDSNQLSQVIGNIVINAMQAMPEGGPIELRAENVTLNTNSHPTLSDGNYVKISVIDYGIGMPEKILPKIFDPFFTTKSKGHGLGLTTCYSIIKRHGGCIDVESEPGKGSTFTIYLPAIPNAAIEGANTTTATHHGNGKILVMDDEAVIRDTLRLMLESMGYKAHCVVNSEEACQVFEKERNGKDQFTSVILDLTIPGGPGGKETIRQIRLLDKSIPVFVASGYADDPVMANPGEYGFTDSICKPFRKAELAKILNKHLLKQN
jgi:PAS domain S-box-containing protein